MLVQIDDPEVFAAAKEALQARGLRLRYAGTGHYVAGDGETSRRITPLLGAVAVADDALRHGLGLRRDEEPRHFDHLVTAEYVDVTTGRRFFLSFCEGQVSGGQG